MINYVPIKGNQRKSKTNINIHQNYPSLYIYCIHDIYIYIYCMDLETMACTETAVLYPLLCAEKLFPQSSNWLLRHIRIWEGATPFEIPVFWGVHWPKSICKYLQAHWIVWEASDICMSIFLSMYYVLHMDSYIWIMCMYIYIYDCICIPCSPILCSHLDWSHGALRRSLDCWRQSDNQERSDRRWKTVINSWKMGQESPSQRHATTRKCTWNISLILCKSCNTKPLLTFPLCHMPVYHWGRPDETSGPSQCYPKGPKGPKQHCNGLPVAAVQADKTQLSDFPSNTLEDSNDVTTCEFNTW